MSSLLQNYGTCILLVDVLLRLFSLYTDLMRRHFRYCRLTDGNGLADVNEKWKNMHIVRAEKKVYQRKNEQEWEKKGNRIYRKSVCSFFFVWSNNWLWVDGRYCVGMIRLFCFKGYFILFAAPKSVNFLCLFYITLSFLPKSRQRTPLPAFLWYFLNNFTLVTKPMSNSISLKSTLYIWRYLQTHMFFNA